MTIRVNGGMERKESDVFHGRSLCDGSLSSIGSSAGVDGLFSPKDVHQLCYAPRRINQFLDDESATGVQRDREARVKFMCSFGGRIMPRPSDGKLRYVGGETRIVSVTRDVTYADIMAKLCEMCDQAMVLKYQMPDEDLDALVSVCNDEDLENMMEEYERLELSESPSRLRAFLFPALVSTGNDDGLESLEDLDRGETSDGTSGHRFPVAEYDIDCFLESNGGNLEQQYIDAVNGVVELSLNGNRKGACLCDSACGSLANSPGVDASQGGSHQGNLLDVSSLVPGPVPVPVVSRGGGACLSSCSPSPLSPRVVAAWTAFSKVAAPPGHHAFPGNCFPAGLQNKDQPAADSDHSTDLQQERVDKRSPVQEQRPDTPGSSTPVGEHGLRAEFQRQGVPRDEPPYGLSPHRHPTDNRGSYLQRLAHLQNGNHHFCHGLPPYQIPSACLGFSQRCCTHQQFQLHGRPPYNGQLYGLPVPEFAGLCGGLHQCCEHSADGLPVWWRHCQSCVHCQYFLQSQAFATAPVLQSDSSSTVAEATYRCPVLTSACQENTEPIHSDSPPAVAKYQQNGVVHSPSPAPVAGKPQENGDSTAVPNVQAQEAELQSETLHDKQRNDGVAINGMQVQTVNVAAGVTSEEPIDGNSEPELSVGTGAVQFPALAMSAVSSSRAPRKGPVKSLLSTSLQRTPATLSDQALEKLEKNGALEHDGNHGPETQMKDKESPTVQTCPDEHHVDHEDKVVSSAAEREATSRGLQTIRNGDLEEIRELGSGTFGTVFYGKWRGSEVAIKRIKPHYFEKMPAEKDRLIADFWKEACTLSKLHHPNVVAFYGVVPDGPNGTLATVTEYMVNGSLKQVLRRKDRTIDRRKRLLIAMDAAIGMEYLHEKKIVHFDLKCENLLVNMRDPQRPICKVGDFGLSKVKHQTMVSGGVRGTLPWMAPELLDSSRMVTEKVDIFSFGIVMWELLTGEEPYANLHYGAIIGGIVQNNLRPTIPDWCDPSWKSLMERCWAADPAERPSFSQVASDLRAMTVAPLQPKTQNQGQPSSS